MTLYEFIGHVEFSLLWFLLGLRLGIWLVESQAPPAKTTASDATTAKLEKQLRKAKKELKQRKRFTGIEPRSDVACD